MTAGTDVRYAARALTRSPRWAIMVVASLSLGVGANAAMFHEAERLFLGVPPGIPDPKDLVRLYETTYTPPLGPTTGSVGDYPRFGELSRGVHGLEYLAALATTPVTVGRGVEARQLTAQLVSPSFFPLLGVAPALGRFFTAEDDRERAPVAVIGYELWRHLFAADSAVPGRSLRIGQTLYIIVGVAPPRFVGPDWRQVDLWVPLQTAAPALGYSLNCQDCRWLAIIGRLRPGVARAAAEMEATGVLRRSAFAQPGESASVAVLGPLQAARGPQPSVESTQSLRLIVMAVLVYLMMCANIANLTLARAVHRRREMAIRSALGASALRIAKQVFSEEIVILLLGGLGAVFVATWSSSLLSGLMLRGIYGANGLDLQLIGLTLLLIVPAVLVSNVMPAILVGGGNALATLAGSNSIGTGRSARARRGLISLQVAVTLVLLFAAGLFLNSLRNMLAVPLGFDTDKVVSISVDLDRNGYSRSEINAVYARLQESVERVPGVVHTALAVGSPFATSLAISFSVPGADDSIYRSPAGGPYVQAVSSEYFATLGTALRRGRTFVPEDNAGSHLVAIVNETMARRFWPFDDAVGKCLKIGTRRSLPCTEIVGVVADVKRIQLTEEPTMQYYVPLAQTDTTFALPITALLVRTGGKAESAIGALRSAIQGVSPDMPYASVAAMSDLYEWQLRPWRLSSTVLGLFGALALILASVGLFGLLSYLVVSGTREIGVRMALGASRTRIVALVVGQGASIVLVGLALGALAVRLLGRYLAATVYGVSAGDVLLLAEAAGILLAVSCAACYGPARRAMLVDPAVALKAD